MRTLNQWTWPCYRWANQMPWWNRTRFLTRCSGKRAAPIPKNSCESLQIFFLLLLHSLIDICPSQGEDTHPLGCSPGRFGSAAKPSFNFVLNTHLFPFLISRKPAFKQESKESEAVIPISLELAKLWNPEAAEFSYERQKSHFNQNTHYAPYSWLILHPFQLQGE